MSNYGFTSSKEVKLNKTGFPVGKYVVYADCETDTPTGVNVIYHIKSGEMIGTEVSVYYNTLSDNAITAKIAREDIRRIADATGKDVDAQNPIQGRTFMVDVIENAKNPAYTNVKAYLPADGVPTYVKEAKASIAAEEIPF